MRPQLMELPVLERVAVLAILVLLLAELAVLELVELATEEADKVMLMPAPVAPEAEAVLVVMELMEYLADKLVTAVQDFNGPLVTGQTVNTMAEEVLDHLVMLVLWVVLVVEVLAVLPEQTLDNLEQLILGAAVPELEILQQEVPEVRVLSLLDSRIHKGAS